LGEGISRDPIGEEGGRNLYGALQNDTVARVDARGLEEFIWEEPTEENGGKPGSGGMTDWDHFEPTTEVYSMDGCCFGVQLSGGSAQALVVYNDGEWNGKNILLHERVHVLSHMRPAYEGFKSAAAGLDAPCMSKGRAVCLQSVIEGPLKDEYVALSYRDGSEYDWVTYGQAATDPLLQEAVRERMARLAAAYTQAQAATVTALAACMTD